MRIGLNLLHAMPAIGGGWNYIARLVAALGDCDQANLYVAFVTDQSGSVVPRKSNFEIVHVGINPTSRPQRVLYENTLLQMAARKHRLDLMHWFGNTQGLGNAVPSVVTIYDLLVFQNPRLFPPIQRLYLRIMISYAAKYASFLLPMSNTTAQALGRILNVANSRMVVIPAIVNQTFRPVVGKKTEEFRSKHALPNLFWLYVAHFYPHKNHLRLLQAYHELKAVGFDPWPLVLRGDDHGTLSNVMEVIRHLGLDNDVICLPRLDEDDLPILFSAARAMVFPSLYEGAGIPILEAMACGCPVIASDIPTTREFGDKAVLRFDPLRPTSIGEAMRTFQMGAPRRFQARQLGLHRVQQHAPSCVAKKLVDVYQRAVVS